MNDAGSDVPYCWPNGFDLLSQLDEFISFHITFFRLNNITHDSTYKHCYQRASKKPSCWSCGTRDLAMLQVSRLQRHPLDILMLIANLTSQPISQYRATAAPCQYHSNTLNTCETPFIHYSPNCYCLLGDLLAALIFFFTAVRAYRLQLSALRARCVLSSGYPRPALFLVPNPLHRVLCIDSGRGSLTT